ncbi:YcaO-like family protein [Amycolatopsis sp. cg5]|uniref:YcaO-like family protein n=1 Tax=Amycolatopsis sp. cg5 TaxID=3238802 RepID=UPI003526B9C1
MVNLAPAETTATASAAVELRARLSPVAGMFGPVSRPVRLPVPEGIPELPIASSASGDLRWVLPEVAAFGQRTGRPTSGLDGAGGGFDGDLAEWVAVAEALERYCSTVYSRDQLIVATADELGDEALDLYTLPELSDQELADERQRIGIPRKDRARSWVRGVRLADARPVWIPAELVWLCFDEPGAERLATANSTGCAVHSDPWQALLNGLLEVIERDAISIAWRQRLPLPEIEVDDASPELRELLARFDANPGVSMRLFDATLDLGVPTVYAVYQEHLSPRLRHVLGCGINPSADKAAANAVREAISCRLALEHQGPAPTDPGTFGAVFDGALYMGLPENAEGFDFLVGPGRTGGTTALSKIRSAIPESSPKRYLTELLAKMRKSALDVFAVDIGCDESREVGLTAIKAIVPGLQPLSFTHSAQFLATPRLYAAPAACGYPVRSLEDLNPWPQPFA